MCKCENCKRDRANEKRRGLGARLCDVRQYILDSVTEAFREQADITIRKGNVGQHLMDKLEKVADEILAEWEDRFVCPACGGSDEADLDSDPDCPECSFSHERAHYMREAL